MTEPSSLGLTRRLADFSVALKYQDLAPEVIADTKNAILDWLGVALVGSTEPSTRMILNASANLDSGGKATLLGMTRQASPAAATLVNGLAGHALDYDDVQHRCGVHMTAPVLPVALVLSETLRPSGKEFLTAYLAGFEVGCRLGRAARFGNHLRMHGIHPTGFLGHFGAAGTAAKFLGLNSMQTRRSYGIVAGKAAALMRSFGTMCKPMNAGNAAQDGLLSALLAKQGFEGPDEIFDGKHNIFSLSGGETDPEQLVQGLGQEFEINHNTFKAFACTGWRNPIVEALIVLSTTHQLQAKDVKKIHVQIYDEMMHLPDKPEPQSGLEGKFSVAHVSTVALVDRAGGIAQFTDKRVADPVLKELRRKVTVEAGKDLDHYQVRVFLHTNDGRELTHFVPIPKGDHLRPLTRDELVAKFRANASAVLPQGQVDKLAEMISSIEKVKDMAELVRLCRPGKKSSAKSKRAKSGKKAESSRSRNPKAKGKGSKKSRR